MKPVCEVMVLEVFPGIRAMVAKNMMENHGFSQKLTAKKLGTTQPAISQYKRQMRGSKFSSLESSPELVQMIDSISLRTAEGKLSHEDIVTEFCSICKFMRKKGLACEFHKNMYPSLENCTICMDEPEKNC